MRSSKMIIFALFSIVLANCSAQQTYEGLQQNARNECAKSANQAQYRECMERTNMSYAEYEQKRKEQDKDPD